MANVMHITALFGWVCFVGFSTRAPAQDNFTLAIRNQSTSPRLMLVTVEFADRSQRIVVTNGQTLMTALAKERGFEKWPNASEVARTAALVGRDKPFRFTKPETQKMLAPSYTPEVLAEVRKKLSGFTVSELRARLRRLNGFKDIYPADADLWWRYEEAVAHVLLEKGIPVQTNCIDGSLGLAQ